VAAHAAALRYENLGDLTVTRARQVVLDWLGVAVGGAQTPLGQLTLDYAAKMRAGNEATLVGDGRCSSLEGAAFANGTISCILGMTETHRRCGHVATEVVPAALAIAEQRHLSGRELITAMAAGYDVFGVIQPAVRQPQRVRGLDHKGQAGTMASAIAAGLALGLDEPKLGHALALSMDMACGTEQYAFDAGLCDTEGLLAGYAASNGIVAAKMADFGFKGPPGALDGAYGYFHAFGNGYNLNFLDSLGKVSALAETGFKKHSGCRCVHACADATLDLVSKGLPPLEEIVSLHVGGYRDAITPAFRVNYEPESADAAGYSLPVTVATILTRHGFYREDIEAHNDPEIRRLMPLVKVSLDEAIDSDYPNTMGCVVSATTRDGRTYEGRVQFPKGEPENMLTDSEFEYKFRRLTEGVIGKERADQIIDMALRLEDLEDVSALVRLTAKDQN
jgi:2-methylcitrate dehydratase PrpD